MNHETEGAAQMTAAVRAVARELYEALEHDVRFFDSIAEHPGFEATGIGNLCRGYAARRRELLAKVDSVANRDGA